MFGHELGASNNERDKQDTSTKDPRRERDKQNMPMRSLETQNSTYP